MVKELFDNSDKGISANEAVEMIKNFFKAKFPSYLIKNENVHPPFWSIIYYSKDIEVKIEGDAGFSVVVCIDKKEYPLWQFDWNVSKATKTNRKNIEYVLNSLNEFLKEQK